MSTQPDYEGLRKAAIEGYRTSGFKPAQHNYYCSSGVCAATAAYLRRYPMFNPTTNGNTATLVDNYIRDSYCLTDSEMISFIRGFDGHPYASVNEAYQAGRNLAIDLGLIEERAEYVATPPTT